MPAPQFDYPADHKFAMRVPKGGSDCAKCEYVSDDKKHCHNHFFQRANGDRAALPYPADEFCCDCYETKK